MTNKLETCRIVLSARNWEKTKNRFLFEITIFCYQSQIYILLGTLKIENIESLGEKHFSIKIIFFWKK